MSQDNSGKQSVNIGLSIDAIKSLLGPLSNLTATGVIFWLVIFVHPDERKEWRQDRDSRMTEWTQTIKENSTLINENSKLINQMLEELRRQNKITFGPDLPEMSRTSIYDQYLALKKHE